ncbi:hypothetical protein CAOG_010051 [Capsaspora owczarzaki ATCC 30864]|uniref:Uncharacterized protein n=1 Tax=Capsaspora owczarzaki (strain ATCC 30864) TaxID=595528 RepID=A0A0D2X4W7_CAPO3|nr:hypothetical protein CAOG_010051 [Capsaspora owczarzaki ATCC 30864]
MVTSIKPSRTLQTITHDDAVDDEHGEQAKGPLVQDDDGDDDQANMHLLCCICVEPLVDNRQCPRCCNMCCKKCLESWVAARPTHLVAVPCPMCRQPAHLNDFKLNAEKQQAADAIMLRCSDGCGAVLRACDRGAHATRFCLEATIPCPFIHCKATMKRKSLDVHVFSCPFRTQYSEKELEAAVDLAEGRSVQDESRVKAALRASSLRQETIVHYVKENETLAGLAIKYGTSKEEIKRLNRLVADNIHTHVILLMPKSSVVPPPPAEPNKEVLEALRRRRMLKQFIRVAECELHEHAASTQEYFRCFGCKVRELDDQRTHCSSCGRFFCSACSPTICGQSVSKQSLGATTPTSHLEFVRVCEPCFTQLDNQPVPTMLVQPASRSRGGRGNPFAVPVAAEEEDVYHFDMVQTEREPLLVSI